jgi:zinc/manganese transport system substrate-binding protein
VAHGLNEALADLDRANADYYRQNLKAFSAKFDQKQMKWQALGLQGKKFVAYHKLFEYLAAEYGFRIVGYVEPKPGIPPSAAHVESLIESMKNERPDGILTTSYYGGGVGADRRETSRVILLPETSAPWRGTTGSLMTNSLPCNEKHGNPEFSLGLFRRACY